ncbi:hypothetical protein J1614_005238 [Plenodomus biglobosus]|nr:hypothetical protein J1614_005238 [Plenodomus biglobosus]
MVGPGPDGHHMGNTLLRLNEEIQVVQPKQAEWLAGRQYVGSKGMRSYQQANRKRQIPTAKDYERAWELQARGRVGSMDRPGMIPGGNTPGHAMGDVIWGALPETKERQFPTPQNDRLPAATDKSPYLDIIFSPRLNHKKIHLKFATIR